MKTLLILQTFILLRMGLGYWYLSEYILNHAVNVTFRIWLGPYAYTGMTGVLSYKYKTSELQEKIAALDISNKKIRLYIKSVNHITYRENSIFELLKLQFMDFSNDTATLYFIIT